MAIVSMAQARRMKAQIGKSQSPQALKALKEIEAFEAEQAKRLDKPVAEEVVNQPNGIIRKQARKGGEMGINGEWFEGGQFLPQREDSVKAAKVKGTGKQEIAAFKWEVPPQEGLKSIWQAVIVFAVFKKTGFSKETGSQGTLTWFDRIKPEKFGLTEQDVERLKDLMARWNNGERWF